MAKRSTMRVEGARELERFMLRELPVQLARKATLAGMRRSAKPMVNLAKAKVAFRSGALQQSLGIKTVPARQGRTASQLTSYLGGNDHTFAAIEIGPLSGSTGAGLNAWARYRSHYYGTISIRRKGKTSTKLIGRIRHGHLIEFGFRHARSGRKVGPWPYLDPAFKAAWPTYNRMFVGETRKRVEAAIRKHNSRSSGPK